MIAELNKEEIKEKYNDIKDIWSEKDHWHSYTNFNINSYINKVFKKYSFLPTILILNAGSGGSTYGIASDNIIHLDIAKNKIQQFPNFIVSSIEKIPIEDNFFDMCICVGSVINYCNVINAINEIIRVIKPGGYLILEFEKTKSLELIFTSDYNRCAKIVNTFYNGGKERIWMYSEGFVFDLIRMNNCRISNIYRFHIFSPLIYKLCKSENFASRFVCLDKVLRKVPLLNKFSSNIILTSQKIA